MKRYPLCPCLTLTDSDSPHVGFYHTLVLHPHEEVHTRVGGARARERTYVERERQNARTRFERLIFFF